MNRSGGSFGHPRLARRRSLWAIAIALLAFAGCERVRDGLLFYPTHHASITSLSEWRVAGTTIGFARTVPAPKNVWLLLHGNAGQAADREYALPSFSDTDSVYILEYPGYGARPGKPSPVALSEAAAGAYEALLAAHPGVPVCVAAESIGSGPACGLARHRVPPPKLVLIVPFDDLAAVAADHYPWLPVRTIMGPTWNNVAALAGYRGRLEIYGALDDRVIPIRHAKALADAIPGARFHLLACGHNGWSTTGQVQIRNP